MKKKKFSELGLSADIMKGVAEMGFEEATQIQTETIPLMMTGADLIGQAQTGTGKTAAFGIPLLEMINSKSKETQALVICPTRELAVQVAEEIGKIGKHKKGLKVLAVYGGQPIDRQIRALRQGVQIVTGTPGRLIDHINRKTINLSTAGIVVLDEADEMLNMGFIEDIEEILKKAKPERQTVLFSATMPEPILKLTKRYQKNPKHVKITHEVLTAPSIEQIYYELKRGTKLEAVCRLLDAHDFRLVIIFCNTKMMVDQLSEQLNSRGYICESLHGDKTQGMRDKVMEKVRSGKADILIATDVAARGIDIDDIDAVINYDIPADEEYYVHRIGRTGRAGRTGKAFTFVYPDEIFKIRDIMRYAKVKIKQGKIPTRESLEDLRTERHISQIREVLKKGGLDKEIKVVEKLASEDFTSVEIAAALYKLFFNVSDGYDEKGRFFEDVNAPERTLQDSPSNRDRYLRSGLTGRNRNPRSDMKMTKLFMNIGKGTGAQVKDILGSITGETGLKGEHIGRIDMFDRHSFVNVDSKEAENVIRKMSGRKVKGTKVFIERAKEKRS